MADSIVLPRLDMCLPEKKKKKMKYSTNWTTAIEKNGKVFLNALHVPTICKNDY